MYNPKPTEVVLMNVRLSYVHLMKPYSQDPATEPKYSCTILLPKTDVAGKAKIDAAIAAAKQQGASDKWNGVVPPIVPDPIHDGDGVKQDGTAFGPECKGMWVFTASSKQDRPIEVVDRNNNKILDPTQIYSGIIANVFVQFFPYAYQGKKGIGCGLGPVQKMADGESLGGGAPSAASVFGSAAAPAQNINPLTGQPM
jgi:hypothetical protein